MVDLAQNLNHGIGGLIWMEGEPGIGKSRLMEEFVATNEMNGTIVWTAKCSPQRSGNAFSLFSGVPFM